MGLAPCGPQQVLTLMGETKPEKTKCFDSVQSYSYLRFHCQSPSIYSYADVTREVYTAQKIFMINLTSKDPILFCLQKQDSCMAPRAF